MVSANHWLRGIKTYRLLWYLTRVSANHASSNWALVVTLGMRITVRRSTICVCLNCVVVVVVVVVVGVVGGRGDMV